MKLYIAKGIVSGHFYDKALKEYYTRFLGEEVIDKIFDDLERILYEKNFNR